MPTNWEPRVLWAMLGFEPHPAQHQVLQVVADALRHKVGAPRFLDVVTGRQWGKTMAAEVSLWMALTEPDDEFGPPAAKVISDTYAHGLLIWDKFIQHAYNSPYLSKMIQSYDKSRELLTLTTGASAQLLSTDNPQSVTGYTLTFALVDEAAFVNDKAMEHLMPCLAVRQGVVLAFGTAEGVGWHRAWYIMGQDPNYPNHRSYQFPSTSNPYFPPEELDTQKAILPERRFRQLYFAEWQTEEGAVFHNIEGCVLKGESLDGQAYDKRRVYVAGADFGRHTDWTVVYVADARTGRLVYQSRFRYHDWMAQVEMVMKVLKDYGNPSVICDATGVGDAVVDMLRERGADVVPVVLTPSMKEKIVGRLVVAIEREDVRFPEWPELVQELKLYETRVLPSGKTVTSAPVGFHDDCVMAFALVNDGMWRGFGRNAEDKVAVEHIGSWEER